jgi:hypothetical protein
VTAFDTRTRVVLTASRDGFFNPCNPKARHCYNTISKLIETCVDLFQITKYACSASWQQKLLVVL